MVVYKFIIFISGGMLVRELFFCFFIFRRVGSCLEEDGISKDNIGKVF